MSIVKLPGARLFFNDLFEANAFKAGQNKSFRAVLGIVPGSANHQSVEAAILEVAKEKFQKKAEAKIEAFRPVPQQFPVKDGNKLDWDGAEGNIVVTAVRGEKSGKPLVLSNQRHNGKFIELIDASGTPYGRDADGKLVNISDEFDGEIIVPYSGCYVNASVEFWAQDGENPGIRCQLRGIQFARDGDAFSGGSKAKADEFDDLASGSDAADLL
jgi:hypothetical protein